MPTVRQEQRAKCVWYVTVKRVPTVHQACVECAMEFYKIANLFYRVGFAEYTDLRRVVYALYIDTHAKSPCNPENSTL